jgi:hypothetical protein
VLRDYLNALGYNGPVSLACDDTKLRPSLRPYWDPELGRHVVVGGVQGPIVVLDTNELEATLQAEGIARATKVRVYL